MLLSGRAGVEWACLPLLLTSLIKDTFVAVVVVVLEHSFSMPRAQLAHELELQMLLVEFLLVVFDLLTLSTAFARLPFPTFHFLFLLHLYFQQPIFLFLNPDSFIEIIGQLLFISLLPLL